MNLGKSSGRILANVPSDRFVGRGEILDRLRDGCIDGAQTILLATPMGGATELLRQTYDSLFRDQAGIVPFYFEFRRSDRTARSAALRFTRDFLTQSVAFRRNDPGITRNAPEICEIAELAPAEDGYWIDRLIETCHSGSVLNDDAALILNCLSSPLRAANAGLRVAVIVDALHIADEIEGGRALANEIFRLFSSNRIGAVLSGYRRAVYGRGDQPVIELNALASADADKCIANLAGALKIETTDQTRDLIAALAGERPGMINLLLRSAGDRMADLSNYDSVARIYTDEVFGGRTGKRFDELLGTVTDDGPLRRSVFAFLNELRRAENETLSIDEWLKSVPVPVERTRTILRLLHVNEIINLSDGGISSLYSPTFIRDLIEARIDLEIEKRPRALAVGDAIGRHGRRAPQMMTERYRRSTAIGLRELIAGFDGRPISPVLLDYGRFKDELKGTDDERSLNLLCEANDKFDTPRITYTSDAVALYPRISEIVEPERAAVGIGHIDAPDRLNIAVIAAEVESKLEVDRDTAEFWLDRMEMLAANCGFENYRVWLVSREGFDLDAMSAIRSRRAYSSCQVQIRLLRELLGQKRDPLTPPSDEFEVVIPMGDDTEMIAAHMIEEVGRRQNIDTKVLNKIKTAVVEGCINASEHGHSPDRKIYLRFSIKLGKAVITIYNRGVRIDESKLKLETPEGGRRGWGFKLMRNLMDEVMIENSDEGTRVTLVKRLD